MTITRLCAPLMSLLLLSVMFDGCDGTDNVPATNPTELSHDTRYDRLSSNINELGEGIAVGRLPGSSFYEQLEKDVAALSHAMRHRAFNLVKSTFTKPRLKTSNLVERIRLFECYTINLRELSFAFSEVLDDPGEVWEYALQSMDMFDAEKEQVSCLKPDKPPVGLHLPQGEYLKRIDQKRFYAVRRLFEGQCFSRFYRSLPETQQKKWLARIEKVAGREVVVYDPANPNQPLPRFPVQVPVER